MKFFRRIANLFSRSKMDREIQDELRSHIEMRAEDNIARGMSPDEARREARLKFGNPAVMQERVAHADLALGLDIFFRDVRYAWRMLWRSKGFTAIAVGSLALGIGANAIIFSLAKGVLLDRLPVPHPDQMRLLVVTQGKNMPGHGIWSADVLTMDRNASPSLSYPIYRQMMEQNGAKPNASFGGLVAFKDTGKQTVAADGVAEVATTQLITGNFYQEMGVQPVLGRGIQPADDVPGAAGVVVISDAFWARRFGRSPAVIGKAIQINLSAATIIGVNPAQFAGATNTEVSPDVFAPLTMQPVVSPMQVGKTANGSLLESNRMWWVQTAVRLRPGVQEEAGRLELEALLAQALRANLALGADVELPKVLLMDYSHGMGYTARAYRQPIYVLSGLAGFVLLLACANLANLLLARSAARQREMSLRLALGASRSRVLRQVLTESLLLSSLGGAAGFALGYVGRNVIPHLLSAAWRPPVLEGRFNLEILAFTAGVSLLTGALFGLAPAWRAMRTDVNGSLKDASVSATRRRRGFAGASIVVFQIALSTILVGGAGLFARTLMNLNSTRLGFQTENLYLFTLQAPKARYQAPQDVALHERMEERLGRIPGVQAVTVSEIVLVSKGALQNGFKRLDQENRTSAVSNAYYNGVGQSFFETYRIPILSGRSFTASDTATSPLVAIINQTLANKIYPGADPVGRSFSPADGADQPVYQIIGVSADTKYSNLRDAVPPTVYTFYRQNKREYTLNYVVKTAMPAETIAPAIRHAVAEMDRDIPIGDMRTQRAQIDDTISQERLLAMLTAAFGGLALMLACIGIYGLMAYDVARRTSEIGIRMALGARRGQMLTMVLRSASWMSITGIAVGLGGTLLLSKYVKAMLYGLTPNDPWVLGGASLLLLVVAIASGFGPARRAARVAPMVALRME